MSKPCWYCKSSLPSLVKSFNWKKTQQLQDWLWRLLTSSKAFIMSYWSAQSFKNGLALSLILPSARVMLIPPWLLVHQYSTPAPCDILKWRCFMAKISMKLTIFGREKRKVFPFFVFQRIFCLSPHCDFHALFVIVEAKPMLEGPEVFGWNFLIDLLANFTFSVTLF